MLKELLPTRTKQRLILAARAADHSRKWSREAMEEEAAVLDDPHATAVEMCSATVAVIGHRVMEMPVAVIAGTRELLRKR